jgi:hypothetical protein
MAFELSTGARNAACDAIVDAIDTGGTGTIQIRTGAQPGSPNDAASGTLLATLTFSATAFGAAASGTATANAITSDTSVDATGTAGYARILDGAAATIADMDIGQGSGTLNFDDTSFISGGTAAISSLTVTVPES